MRGWLLIAFGLFIAWRPLCGDEADFFKRYGCPIFEQVSRTEYAPVADAVVGLAAIESGYGSARWVEHTRQVFGITENRKRKKGERPVDLLRRFDSVGDAVAVVLQTFRKRHYPTDLPGFLARFDDAGYSKDKGQGERIAGTLKRVRKGLEKCEKAP